MAITTRCILRKKETSINRFRIGYTSIIINSPITDKKGRPPYLRQLWYTAYSLNAVHSKRRDKRQEYPTFFLKPYTRRQFKIYIISNNLYY